MTAIKQVAVTSKAHLTSLSRYLNDDRALARGSQHLADETTWAEEMDVTREAYGHNLPSRRGAAVTYMYHQVIAFNPDECSCNGGPMTPEACMEFARQWVEGRYPCQEAMWILHEEHCAADGTNRYACHIAINRTNIWNGNRLCEGRGQAAKVARANAMRALDARWGLAQMVEGERNSLVHAMQPSRAEREMSLRGIETQKAEIRRKVRRHVMEIREEDFRGDRVGELARRLEADGVGMSMGKGGNQVTFSLGEGGFGVSGSRLGRGFSMTGLTAGLGIRAGMALANGVEQDMG